MTKNPVGVNVSKSVINQEYITINIAINVNFLACFSNGKIEL